MKPDEIDALLEEIDRIARSYNLDRYGLPIKSDHLNHAEPTQAMREAVSRFVERVKKEMTNGSGTVQGSDEHIGNDLRISGGGGDPPAVHPSGDGDKVADAALPSAPRKCPRCGSEKKHEFAFNYSQRSGCTSYAYHEFHNGWEDSVPDAVPPAQREAEGAPTISINGLSNLIDQYRERLAHYSRNRDSEDVPSEIMTLGNVVEDLEKVASECSAASPTKAGMSVAVGRDSMGLWCSRCGTLRKPCQHFDVLGDVLAGADRSPDTKDAND